MSKYFVGTWTAFLNFYYIITARLVQDFYILCPHTEIKREYYNNLFVLV